MAATQAGLLYFPTTLIGGQLTGTSKTGRSDREFRSGALSRGLLTSGDRQNVLLDGKQFWERQSLAGPRLFAHLRTGLRWIAVIAAGRLGIWGGVSRAANRAYPSSMRVFVLARHSSAQSGPGGSTGHPHLDAEALRSLGVAQAPTPH